MRPPLIVALTGGIASGKTQVSDRLASLGAAIVDTDVLAREVVAPGTPGLDQLVAAFGPRILDDDGALDRAGLRALVFADADARQTLQAITHPLIRDAAIARAREASGPYLVYVVPLLVGSAFQRMADRTLVVDCPRARQLHRLLVRDDETPERAIRMLDAQSSRAERLAIADDVIVNDDGLETLDRKCAALHAFYLSLAADSRTRA